MRVIRQMRGLPCTFGALTASNTYGVSEFWSFNKCRRNASTHSKSTLKKNHAPGFLKNLNERKKAAYGTFLLPNGTDGFFVVPFCQPPPPTSRVEGRDKHNVLFCKLVLGLNLVDGGRTIVPPPRLAANETESVLHPANDDCAVPTMGGKLKNILRAQQITDERVASAPTLPKRPVRNAYIPAPKNIRSAGQNWHCWRKL